MAIPAQYRCRTSENPSNHQKPMAVKREATTSGPDGRAEQWTGVAGDDHHGQRGDRHQDQAVVEVDGAAQQAGRRPRRPQLGARMVRAEARANRVRPQAATAPK